MQLQNPSKKDDERLHVFFAILGFILASTCVLIWWATPIYPDEIAFRVQTSRALQDGGNMYGLWSLCTDRIKTLPWLFVPSAWILSFLDMALNPTQMRVLSMGVILLCLGIVTRHSIQSEKNYACFLLPLIGVGVAGSSLVFARFEYVLLLNIACCLAALSCVHAQRVVRGVVGICLTLSMLGSLLAHSQGVLFIPLSLFALHGLMWSGSAKSSMQAMLFWIGIFGVLVFITMDFHRLSCVGYPGIEAFWKKAVFDLGIFKNFDAVGFIINKVNAYITAFTYKTIPSVAYIPEINKETFEASSLFYYVNNVIAVVVTVTLIALIVVAVIAAYRVVWSWLSFNRKQSEALPISHYYAYLFLAVPVIGLFFYDMAQYFYRSMMLHFIAVIALVYICSLYKNKKFPTIMFVCGIIGLLGSLGSFYLNIKYYAPMLPTHEVVSVAQSRGWDNIRRDVMELSERCGLDLTKGHIGMDDFTYDAVKHASHVYHINYIGLQAGLAQIESSDIVKKLNPQGVIARCNNMRETKVGMPAQHRLDAPNDLYELCCTRFSNPP